MKKIFAFILLTLAAQAWALTPTPVQKFARAIAKAEGFETKGAKPKRLHNPGDIRSWKKNAYPGMRGTDSQGYVIFRNDKAGMAALEGQINRVVVGKSTHYNVNMTLKQFGRKYATGRTWANNVAHNLGVMPTTRLWEILDVPPVLTVSSNSHALDGLFRREQ